MQKTGVYALSGKKIWLFSTWPQNVPPLSPTPLRLFQFTRHVLSIQTKQNYMCFKQQKIWKWTPKNPLKKLCQNQCFWFSPT
jgi:hypothetical protein